MDARESRDCRLLNTTAPEGPSPSLLVGCFGVRRLRNLEAQPNAGSPGGLESRKLDLSEAELVTLDSRLMVVAGDRRVDGLCAEGFSLGEIDPKGFS